MMMWTAKPRRLERLYQAHAYPVYFVTAVTAHRRALLAAPGVHQVLIDYAIRNAEAGRAMGRYVLMPDHMHFLVRLQPETRLADYVRMLKQQLTLAVRSEGMLSSDDYVWQPGFFDRLLRSAEKTGQVWEYMIDNPLEAGLAKMPEDWPYQGEIVPIRF